MEKDTKIVFGVFIFSVIFMGILVSYKDTQREETKRLCLEITKNVTECEKY